MRLIALLAGGGSRANVANELHGRGQLVWCPQIEDLLARADAGGIDAAIVGLEDETGRSIAPTLVELAARHPAIPALIHGRVDGATLGALLSVVPTGARVEWAVRPYERLEPVVRRLLSPDYRPGVAPVLLQRFVGTAPPTLRVFIAVAALSAAWRRPVERVTLWSGVSPRTIERRLLRAGWPSARTVVRSFAALDAVWLMSEYGWSARRVTRERLFAHESGVTRLVARYCGMQPATLREDGGFAAALAQVTQRLSAGDAG